MAPFSQEVEPPQNPGRFRLSGARIGDDLELSVAGSVETMTLKNYYTQNHDWQVKDVLGTVRGLDDLLADNATRNASLSELDRLREAYVGGINDTAITDYLGQGYTPQADGSWQTFPSFMVSRGGWDYERLPGWSGYVPADSSWYGFSNASWYSTGRFDLSVYSSDAAEITPADFLNPSSGSWQQVLSKVQVTWDSQNHSDPQQTVNIVAGSYQYSASEWTSILNNALLPLGLSIYDFNFNGIDVRNVSMNGLSNPYTSTTTPTYTHQYTTTHHVGTVLSIEPSDGTGYNIDTTLAVDFFNLAILPTTLNVLLGVHTLDRHLQVIEGGNGDNLIEFSNNEINIIVHAGAGNDTVNGGSTSYYGEDRYHFSYRDYYTPSPRAFLDGGIGDDLIESGFGADLIIEGAGNDVLKGSGGQDRYIFLAGQTGIDVVLDDAHNFDSSFGRWWNYLQQGAWNDWYSPVSNWDDIPRAHDFLEIEAVNAYEKEVDWASLYDYGGLSQVIPPDSAEFGEGVAPSDLSFAWSTEAVEVVQMQRNEWGYGTFYSTTRWHQTLDITWQSGAVARFVMPNPDDVHGFGVELFKFADGTQLTAGQMVALAGGYRGLIEGTHGNDSLTGTSATDWIFGFAGNDILHGGDDRDFIFSGVDDSILYGEIPAQTPFNLL
ncbi:MAG: hypothetical protein B7Y21_13055 [Hydrogenophilales bacterium 16-61-112]|nr:MAG: hypothetical protein B7Y21_13055 [Hydrogenophilales bacterium 16-61-112]